MFDAALYVLRPSRSWRALLREFGPWQTAFHHFNAWRKGGVPDRLARDARRHRRGGASRLDSVLRQRHERSGRRVRRRLRRTYRGRARVQRNAGARGPRLETLPQGSRHQVPPRDLRRRRRSGERDATAGQAHESLDVEARLGGVRGGGPSHLEAVARDWGDSSGPVRAYTRRRRIPAVSTTRPSQNRDENLDSESYRRRNLVERCVGWLKQ